jgi:addiction module HigA family antidote
MVDVHRQGPYPDETTVGNDGQCPSDTRDTMTTAIHHPGEVLAKQLEDVGVSPTELARQLGVPANRITQIINGKRGITGDSALRLAHWFGNQPEFWMSLQARYDLEVASTEAGGAIKRLPTAKTHTHSTATKRSAA